MLHCIIGWRRCWFDKGNNSSIWSNERYASIRWRSYLYVYGVAIEIIHPNKKLWLSCTLWNYHSEMNKMCDFFDVYMSLKCRDASILQARCMRDCHSQVAIGLSLQARCIDSSRLKMHPLDSWTKWQHIHLEVECNVFPQIHLKKISRC